MRSEKIYRTRKRRGDLCHLQNALTPDHVRLGLCLIHSRGNEKKTSFGKALGVSATRLGQTDGGRPARFHAEGDAKHRRLLGKVIFELQLDPKVERDLGSTLHSGNDKPSGPAACQCLRERGAATQPQSHLRLDLKTKRNRILFHYGDWKKECAGGGRIMPSRSPDVHHHWLQRRRLSFEITPNQPSNFPGERPPEKRPAAIAGFRDRPTRSLRVSLSY